MLLALTPIGFLRLNPIDLHQRKLLCEFTGYKAAAAREAANEKDSSLQTQPAAKSHLQPRGTASYEPMVTDSIKAVNKEEAKMTAGNQVAASYSC